MQPQFSGNEKQNKKSLKGALKTLFSYFRSKNWFSGNKRIAYSIALAVVAMTISVFGAQLSLKSLSRRDFSIFMPASAQNSVSLSKLFIEPDKNFVKDSPDMVLVQNNSLMAVSPPTTVSPQVLGSILGGVESGTDTDSDISEYVVEKGDTLASIASKFGISQDTIMWVNNLTSKSVKPGQTLLILPVSGLVHLVSDKETIDSIAKNYKANKDDILSFNNLSSEGDIYVGDVLVIPGGKMPSKGPQIVSIPLGESYFIIPTEGRISQGAHGVLYNAVDIANSCGKIVVAAAGGVVQRAGYISVGGNRITILHPNGVVTYYGHFSSMIVKPGQTVEAGQIIGYVGQTGYATGCHVHFEVRGAKNFMTKYLLGTVLSWK